MRVYSPIMWRGMSTGAARPTSSIELAWQSQEYRKETTVARCRSISASGTVMAEAWGPSVVDEGGGRVSLRRALLRGTDQRAG